MIELHIKGAGRNEKNSIGYEIDRGIQNIFIWGRKK